MFWPMEFYSVSREAKSTEVWVDLRLDLRAALKYYGNIDAIR